MKNHRDALILKNKYCYRHNKSKKLYQVVGDTILVKINEKWEPGIIYQSKDTQDHYCRVIDDFLNSFTLIDDDGHARKKQDAC